MRAPPARSLPGVLLVLLAACSEGDAAEGGAVADAARAPDTTSSTAEPMDPEGIRFLQGMMTYMADVAGFTECGTGDTYAIAMQGDYRALEAAYLDHQSGPGEPLLVSLTGRLTTAPGKEGGTVPTLVVETFGEAYAGVGCDGGPADRRLEGTEWVLVGLEAGPAVPDAAGATLLLDAEEGQALGSTGCNRFNGSYDLQGGRLVFGLTGTTRMACPEPLHALERGYLEALRLAGSYRLVGDTLELLGTAGPVARFTAR